MKKLYFTEMSLLVVVLTLVLIVITWIPASAQSSSAKTQLEEKLYQAALKEGELNWWGPLSLKEVSIYSKAFTSKYPGIKINYFEGTADSTSEKYLAEYRAGKATADTIDPEPLKPFRDQNLLMNIKDIVEDVNYPKQFCLKDFTGVTQDHTVAGAAYNTKLISPQEVPKSLEDLLDPKWKGKIALEPRFKYFMYITEHFGEKWIVDYLQKLKQQNPIYSKGATKSMVLLGAGEFPIMVGIYVHTVRVAAAKGAPVDVLPISPVGHNAVSPICIPKSAPHPNASKLLIRWWLSPEGQKLNDEVRYKGNPMPGSGTGQAELLEKKGITVVSTSEWTADNEDRMLKVYQKAIGFKKK
jgi:iron(III) transport system substrate-binding protein